MGLVYDHAKVFLKKYPGGIVWFRVKKHAAVIEKYLDSGSKQLETGEKILYVFVGQQTASPYEFFSTVVICLTNRRIIVGRKRILFGYSLTLVTPDMFNDLTITTGLFWSKIAIDTVKECITISNLDKSSTPEIEAQISHYMMKEKKKYKNER